MEIDHLFIFSDRQGIEAEELLRFGFTEGSSRRHPGQGTINRKFYFKNFFLEILWVVAEAEIKQSPAKETLLWERAQFRQNGHSRFGLCLVHTAETDALFENAELYQPHYFPAGRSIDILPNADQPELPWTFRLPYRGGKKSVEEPMEHRNGIDQLTQVEFEIAAPPLGSPFVSFFAKETNIKFRTGDSSKLILEFDFGKRGEELVLEELDLIIRY